MAGVFVAAMLLEALLCHAVEGQYRDSTFQTRGGYSPLTERAAPAGEGITIDPDHALWGSYIHWVVLAKCFPVVTLRAPGDRRRPVRADNLAWNSLRAK